MGEIDRPQRTDHEFVVRLLGSPFSVVFALEGMTEEPPAGIDGLPYGEACVRASDADSLADVLDRAATELGLRSLIGPRVSEQLTWIRFRESSDDRFAYDRLEWAQQLSVVDENGRLALGQPLDRVTVEDLLRTASLGLVDGAPLQPYLIPTIPQGGLEPWGLDWPTLIGHLELFWAGLGALATVDGAISMAERLRDRLRGAPTGLAAIHARAGGTPELLWQVLHRRPLLPAGAADWLGCTSEDAEALLLALGLDDRGDGLWAPDASDDAQVMSKVLLELRDQLSFVGPERETLRGRLQHIVTTGDRAPLPEPNVWEDRIDGVLHDEDDDEAGWSGRATLPLDRLRLECCCEDPQCSTTARITYAGDDRLRFEIDPPGHFEAPSSYLARLAFEQAEDM